MDKKLLYISARFVAVISMFALGGLYGVRVAAGHIVWPEFLFYGLLSLTLIICSIGLILDKRWGRFLATPCILYTGFVAFTLGVGGKPCEYMRMVEQFACNARGQSLLMQFLWHIGVFSLYGVLAYIISNFHDLKIQQIEELDKKE